jgi:hypothetical protein
MNNNKPMNLRVTIEIDITNVCERKRWEDYVGNRNYLLYEIYGSALSMCAIAERRTVKKVVEIKHEDEIAGR